ncbi:MAG: hypothetical protein L3J59_04550 [Methylococcaceae bacterium]|nr:hypothetical protein [Methylococcaceae bacterium]
MRLFFIISIFLLTTINSFALECGIFNYQENKSSGVFINDNKCSELPYISRETVVELLPKARLWLKSIPSKEVSSFQMICQNRSKSIIKLEFSEQQSPWLNLLKMNNCNGWTEDKLSCDGDKDGDLGVYCVKALIKNKSGESGANTAERITSVELRDVKSSAGIEKKQILDLLKPELKLCKKLSQVSQAMEIKWTVMPDNEVNEIQVNQEGKAVNNEVSACMEAAVSAFMYPDFFKKEIFISSF